jgi:hypothetical protein
MKSLLGKVEVGFEEDHLLTEISESDEVQGESGEDKISTEVIGKA